MPRKATPAPPTPHDASAKPAAGGPVLNDRAQGIYDSVSKKWDLDEVAIALLRLACESITRADEAAAWVTRDGLVLVDAAGKVQKHPAALLERDHRAQGVLALQKLGLALQDVGA